MRDQLGCVPHFSRYSGIGRDDLALEVEPEVVARGEIGQPLVADPDHPAVDLVDDGVGHRVATARARRARCRPRATDRSSEETPTAPEGHSGETRSCAAKSTHLQESLGIRPPNELGRRVGTVAGRAPQRPPYVSSSRREGRGRPRRAVAPPGSARGGAQGRRPLAGRQGHAAPSTMRACASGRESFASMPTRRSARARAARRGGGALARGRTSAARSRPSRRAARDATSSSASTRSTRGGSRSRTHAGSAASESSAAFRPASAG